MYEVVELRGVKKCARWQINYSSESCGKANNAMKAVFPNISLAANAISHQCKSAGKISTYISHSGATELQNAMKTKPAVTLIAGYQLTEIHKYSLLMKLQYF